MSTSQTIPFQFATDISLKAYSKLWQAALKSIRLQVAALQRPRDKTNIATYLDELNDYDIGTTQEDVNGTVWKDIHPDPEFREEASRAQKAFSGLMGEVLASSEIAANLAVLENARLALADDSKRLLGVWKRNLKRGGASLEPPEKEHLQNLTAGILNAEEEFLENIREDSQPLELDPCELQGMPEDYLASHPADPIAGKHSILSKLTDILPVLDYCQIQDTREKALRFLRGRASPTNEPVLLRLLDLRLQKANLLGYSNWAEYQLEGQMVGTVQRATEFLEDVFQAIKPVSDAGKEKITQLLLEQEGIVAQPWDVMYGLTRLQKQLLPGFDMKDTRQYFPVDTVLPALQKLVQDLFSLRFQAASETRVWHPSVETCLVFDTSRGEEKLIGRLFFDIYTREGKIDGEAEYSVRAHVKDKQLAEVVLYCNISSPSACLSLYETQNLLHELGHCVHCLVGEQRYAQFAGIGEPARQKDFTEAPSQMLELWLEDKRSFGFAVNKQGKQIPHDVLDMLLKAEQIGRWFYELQVLLAKAKYALDLHTIVLPLSGNTEDIVFAAYARYAIFPSTHGIHEQHSFSHLAWPGYASMYYCYLYSRVISHDLFSEFVKSKDSASKDVAIRYRKMILEKGSSRDAEELVNGFLGRKYSFKAYKEWLTADSLASKT